MRKIIQTLFGTLLLSGFIFVSAGAGEEFKKEPLGLYKLDVSQKYQPNFRAPQKYTAEDMQFLAHEILIKMKKILGVEFDRDKPEHVHELAEFFKLLPDNGLDTYSTPMSDSDILYFVDLEQFGTKELYPQDAKQLVVRFYWEGLARVAALHYKLRVVDNKSAVRPRMSRGKVSDMATTAMFDKRPGISIAQAAAEGKERYDFGMLIKHLHEKGLAPKR